MENLNAEQIKKALGDCMLGDCEPCAYRGFVDCRDSMCFDALALINSQEQRIKELEQECKKWQGRLKIECEYTEKITVKKMLQRIKEDAAAVSLLSNPPKFMLEIREDALDQIAKEMLEGKNEKTHSN